MTKLIMFTGLFLFVLPKFAQISDPASVAFLCQSTNSANQCLLSKKSHGANLSVDCRHVIILNINGSRLRRLLEERLYH